MIPRGGVDEDNPAYWQIKWEFDDGTGKRWHQFRVENDGAPGALTEAKTAKRYVQGFTKNGRKNQIADHDPRITGRAWRNGVTPESMASIPKQITLAEVVNLYHSQPDHPLVPGTIENQRGSVRRVLGAWLDRPVRELTATALSDAHIALAARVSPRTGRPLAKSGLAAEWKAVFPILRFAFEEEYLTENIVAQIRFRRRIKVKDRRPEAQEGLTQHQLGLLLAVAPTVVCRLAILIGADCGLRIGEILALRVKDIDWTTNLLWVRGHVVATNWVEGTKAGKDVIRWVPLSEQLIDELRAWTVGKDDEDYLFPSRRPGHLMTKAVFYRRHWRPMVALARESKDIRASDKVLVTHTLRHTFGTTWALEVEQITLMHLMGHQNTNTTKRYVTHGDAAKALSIKVANEIASRRRTG